MQARTPEQIRKDQIRKEAKELASLLTIDECHGLLAETLPPLTDDAGRSYRVIYQALADANTSDESKERADIFREELRRHIFQKNIIMRLRELNTREAEIYLETYQSLIESGSREGADEFEKMSAEALRDVFPSSPAPELYCDAIVFVADYLKPTATALRALDKQTALRYIKKGDSLSEPEKQLASQAEAALKDQSQFALCSLFFRQTIQFNHKRLLDTLSYQVKRGNFTLVGNVLKSFYEDKKTEDKEIEDKILLLKLLTETFTIEAYPARSLTLMQLAYLEKNGQMCQVIKEAFKQLPDGIKLMQEQLNDPFTKSRSQEETPYDFTALVTAITTDTNVEAELVKFREDLAVIIAERGFPMTIFRQIINIFAASLERPWTDAQYDTLFILIFGSAQQMSTDWLKRAFAAGIGRAPVGMPGVLPFVVDLQYPDVGSIDPVLEASLTGLGLSRFVNLYGQGDTWGRSTGCFVSPSFENFISTNAAALAELTQREDQTAHEELAAPLPRASRQPS